MKSYVLAFIVAFVLMMLLAVFIGGNDFIVIAILLLIATVHGSTQRIVQCLTRP